VVVHCCGSGHARDASEILQRASRPGVLLSRDLGSVRSRQDNRRRFDIYSRSPGATPRSEAAISHPFMNEVRRALEDAGAR
jgi:hypothetical protein